MKKIIFFSIVVFLLCLNVDAKTFKEMQEEDEKFLKEYEHGNKVKNEISVKKEAEYLNAQKNLEEKSKSPLLYVTEGEMSNMSIDDLSDYMKRLKAFCDEEKNKSFSGKCADQALIVKDVCNKRLNKLEEEKKANKETHRKKTGLDNGKLYQCDGIDMFVDEGQRGGSGTRMLDINFHFTSSEIGGTLYWQNDNLPCDCEVFSNGRSIGKQNFNLTAYDQHIFFELDSSDIKKLGKNSQIKCKLQPASKEIVIVKSLFF